MPATFRLAAALASCAWLAGCVTVRAPSPQDPWEGFNRATWEVNDALDRALLRPVARTYVKVVPQPVRTGVNNFLTNLAYTTTLVNNVLQLKLVAALSDTARIALNTTLGLGGFLDPATAAGLARNDEDFGQTLGWWGVPSGPFVMLPLLGPSTLRDSFGLVADYHTDARSHIDTDNAVDFAYAGISIVNRRARLLAAEGAIEGAFDRYALIRNAFLERREFLVRDGDVPERPAEDDLWLDDDEDETGGGNESGPEAEDLVP